MLLGKDECSAILRCPVTREHLAFALDGSSRAKKNGRSYMSVENTPILIDFDSSVIDRNGLLASNGGSSVARRRYAHPWRTESGIGLGAAPGRR
jgi:hypothetical protein